MKSIKDKIKELKEKRDRLKTLQLMKEEQIMSNYVGSYYHDTTSLAKSTVGKLVIITPEQCCIEDAPNGVPHKKAAQTVLNNIKEEHVNIEDLSEADFGFSLSVDYNYIVIRMVPVMIGNTTICLPEKVNTFQLEKLKEFNKYLKEYNDNSKYPVELSISYTDPKFEYTNLDEEINNLEDRIDDNLKTDDYMYYAESTTKDNNK